jgi:hypothetical protein
MITKRTLARPAMSAIAAFLALSASSAFAQAAPNEPAPPTAAEPVARPTPPPTMVLPVAIPPAAPEPAMVTPATAPQPASPKPVIRVPVEIVPETVKAAPRTAERAAPAPARAARSAKPALTPSAAPSASANTPLAEAAPVAAPIQQAAEPMVPTISAPTAVADTVPAGKFPWDMAGAAAALLLAGGAGIAFARRRRAAPDSDIVPAFAPEARPTRLADVPAYISSQAPLPRTTPSFAAAPSGSMGRHEAMALTGPTPDNPFLTLRKRLKRARFYDGKARLAYAATLAGQKDLRRQPASAWDIAQRPVPSVQTQEVHRPDPASPGAASLRPGYFSS